MEKNKVDLRFCVFDFEDISHVDITKKIGINPTRIHVKGEKMNPRNPSSPLWKKNSWSMDSGLDVYADFESQMSAILDIIEQKLEVFKELTDKYYCEFSCAIFTYKDNNESTPWVHLDKRYNKIVGQLNIEFDLDLYAW